MNLDIVSRIARLEKKLDNLVKPERGWSPHFLVTPYTHASFDNDETFSDVAANTLIDNTSWSTTIPANAKALMIRCGCRDSGSAATAGLYVAFVGGAAIALTYTPLVVRPSGKANDDWADGSAIVPCTNGDIWYQCNASGANTMHIILQCYGWWE